MSTKLNSHHTVYTSEGIVKGLSSIYFEPKTRFRSLRHAIADLRMKSTHKPWEGLIKSSKLDETSEKTLILAEREAHLVGELPPALREALFPEVMAYHRKRCVVEEQVGRASFSR